MSLAIEISRLSDEANRIRRLEEETVRRHDRAAEEAELTIRKSEWPLERILSTVREHAGRGERSCLLNLFALESAPPDWAQPTAEHIIAIANSNGFAASYSLDTLEPFGSDPLFDHTVYSGDLTLRW